MFIRWIMAIDRQDFLQKEKQNVRTNYRVCDIHFTDDMKFPVGKNRTNLKYGSIPSLNLPGLCI